jgi:hypothetical protein
MGFFQRLVLAAAFLAASGAHAQGFVPDYSLWSGSAAPKLRVAPGVSLGGDLSSAGLSLQAGRNWFGQVGLAQGDVPSALPHAGTNDIVNLAGGYRFDNGQSLSLQVSRGRGPGQRLGLAVNYDWPRYFVRFSWDQQQGLPATTGTTTDSLRLSAGVRF